MSGHSKWATTKHRKAAQDWLGDYKKAGGDGFLFNSEAGQDVDPIK